jgi:hypothetical protein
MEPIAGDQSGSGGGGSMSSAVSTFVPDLVVPAACAAAVLFWLRARQPAQPAMRAVRVVRAGSSRAADPRALLGMTLLAVATDPDAPGRSGATVGVRRLRALAHDTFGLQPPAAAEFGAAARTSPLRRLRSALLLVVLLVCNGVLVAIGVGVVALLGGFLLEQAIK